ncbi:MAG: hypothetical protein Kow0059_09100 [Candidatus Sumerlaeia bacterium]
MNKRLYIAILSVLAVLLFPYSIATYNNMGEDAFISFRYVRNFVEGRGLVYNEGEWVEGYSNFSWVMLLLLAAVLGGDILLWSKLLAIAANAGMILLMGWHLLERSPNVPGSSRKQMSPIGLFAPLAVFFNPQLHYHSGRGLETCFYAAVFLACVVAMGKKRFLAASLLFALLALSRPEGILHWGLFCVVFLMVECSRRRWSSRGAPGDGDASCVRAFVSLTLPAGLIYGVFLLWRLWTYGQWFPNTVYAKTAAGNFWRNPSLGQVVEFVQIWNGIPLLAAVALLWSWGRAATWRATWIVAGALSVLIYIVSVGRVQAEPFRHFVPLIGPVILLFQEALLAMDSPGRAAGRRLIPRRALWGLAALGLALNFYTPDNGDHPASRLHVRTWRFLADRDWGARWEWFTHPPIHMFAEAGRWAEANLPPGALLAADQMGQLGYYARSHPIIDLLGLMDRHIAHHGLSWEYISRRNPDYFIVYGERGEPYLPNVRALLERDECRRRYRLLYILKSRYDEKIANQFLVYGRRSKTMDGQPPRTLAIGATREEWERYWRF